RPAEAGLWQRPVAARALGVARARDGVPCLAGPPVARAQAEGSGLRDAGGRNRDRIRGARGDRGGWPGTAQSLRAGASMSRVERALQSLKKAAAERTRETSIARVVPAV